MCKGKLHSQLLQLTRKLKNVSELADILESDSDKVWALLSEIVKLAALTTILKKSFPRDLIDPHLWPVNVAIVRLTDTEQLPRLETTVEISTAVFPVRQNEVRMNNSDRSHEQHSLREHKNTDHVNNTVK